MPISLTRPPADAGEVHPRLLAYIALILRVGLGFGLLNVGLFHFLVQSAMGGVMTGQTPYTSALNIVSGMEPLYAALPYVQIVVGLALILGFLTTASAVAAGALVLMVPMLQTAGLIATGPSMNRFNQLDPTFISLVFTGETTRLLHVAAVLWLSSVNKNPWSLDALMFGRRRRKAIDPTHPLGTSSRGQSWPESLNDPGAPFQSKLVKEFDPGSVTDELASGREGPS